MQKEKCDCQGLMLAALAVGILLGLVGGLAIGWNGANYPSETSFILAFLTAAGTIGAALGAAYTAYVALRVARREADKANDEKEKYVNAQIHVLSEWGNRVVTSLRELKSKLRKTGRLPASLSEDDINDIKKALLDLKTSALTSQLRMIHSFPNGEAWAFCISRAESLRQDLQERFKSQAVKEEGDLSDLDLDDRIDELSHVLQQISVLFLWHEYDDSV